MNNSENFSMPEATMGLGFGFSEKTTFLPHGRFFFQLVDDLTGAVLEEWEKDNTLTELSPIFAAYLFAKQSISAQPPFGVNCLLIGTGSRSQGVFDPKKRRTLFSPSAVAPVSQVTFVGGTGNIPTNVIDYKFSFGPTVASGDELDEMGLAHMPNSVITSAQPLISSGFNPPTETTPNILGKDILINYLKFGVITKPPNSTLNITWRLTF